MAYSSKANLFEANTLCDLTELLSQIHTRETALPDFQRNFVWDPPMTKDLIVTIAYNHAAGTVWRIRNTQKVFVWREFEGGPALNGCQPIFLILDAQQRLTGLYRAFYGVGEHRYYVDLRHLLNGSDFEDCVFYLRANLRRALAYETIDVQARELVLPLSVLKGGWATSSVGPDRLRGCSQVRGSGRHSKTRWARWPRAGSARSTPINFP